LQFKAKTRLTESHILHESFSKYPQKLCFQDSKLYVNHLEPEGDWLYWN